MANPKYTDFDLPVTIAGVKFRNPFFVSSGPTTMSVEQIRRIQETGWGAASLKLTIFPTPYINRLPRYSHYNREGYLAFTAEKRLTLDKLLKLIEESRKAAPEVVLWSNITYSDPDIEGWVEMARKCEEAGVQINELNMGCPNMSFNVEMSSDGGADGPKTGASMGMHPELVAQVVQAVKAETSIPIFVKLCPEGGMMRHSAKAAIDAGAAAVGSNANRLAIVPLNLDNPESAYHPLQQEIGLSCMQGPWVLPLGKRDCFEIRRSLGTDGIITATGGVNEWRDAVEMAMCGADLVGICTKTLTHGFDFMGEFIHGVKQYMAEKGYETFHDMRDKVLDAVRSSAEMTIFEGHCEIVNSALLAPCTFNCPAHVPAQGYVRAVADEDFEKAYKLITSANPLQSICGKICDHPCEVACTRTHKDEPLRIRDIKDFVLTYARQQGWAPQIEKASPRSQKVAVVGGGTAGLSAAYDLARAGYKVMVFEAADELGGLLRYLIPQFRMGKEELDADIEMITSLGVEISTGVKLGTDFTIDSLKADGFEAIFLGVGAWSAGMLGIEGETADGCICALDMLNQSKLTTDSLAGKKVGVIGGGFTAIDAARTAVRMGAEEVYILYRRTKDEMPATPEEVVEAEQEGVKVMYLVSPQEVLTENGKVEGLRLVNHVLGEEDTSGRRRPEAVKGTEFVLRLDSVIFAVSQNVESKTAAGIDTDRSGFVTVDETTGQTNIPGVWAGGDCTGGLMDVIAAVAGGKRAAAAIDIALAGEDAFLKAEPQFAQVDVDDVLARESNDRRTWRVPVELRSASQRAHDWNFYRTPMTAQQAVQEAQRCYGCGCGAGCEICKQLCAQFCFDLDNAELQIDQEKCVACGMCIWQCPNQNLILKETGVQKTG